MTNTHPEEQLPLTEATFLILLSLVHAPRHGYAIMKDVERLSDGRVEFSTGTLYGALKRLLEQEWIERRDDATNDDVPQRNQKAYALTERGRGVLAAESRRLQSLVRLSIDHQVLGDV